MQINIIAFAIPLFLFFMGLEYWVARRTKKNYFQFANSIANINVGLAERLLDIFTVWLFYFFYDYLHQHYAIFNLQASVIGWISLLIFTDFMWYWYHRLAHEVNILWSVHIVHHQSEDFNYTASARVTVFQALVRTGFWAILPIIGFPAEMISSILLVHGAYPFFVHTRLVGKLGILEYILVTPSHHRVHHASNEEYLDKNYGDMFIIWDKLFGTFTEEKTEPAYGLVKPLKSYSFLWQHFHFTLELIYATWQTQGWRNKLKIIFGKPELIDANIRPNLEKKFLSRNEAIATSQRFKNYVLLQVALAVNLLFWFLLFEHHISLFNQLIISLIVLITLVNCGAILEQRTWIFYLEYIRVALLILLVYHYFNQPLILFWTLALNLVLIYYFTWVQENYLQLVYGKMA